MNGKRGQDLQRQGPYIHKMKKSVCVHCPHVKQMVLNIHDGCNTENRSGEKSRRGADIQSTTVNW